MCQRRPRVKSAREKVNYGLLEVHSSWQWAQVKMPGEREQNTPCGDGMKGLLGTSAFSKSLRLTPMIC